MGHSPESQSSPPIELASGVDALYLSGRGEIRSALLDDFERLKVTAAEAGAPVDVHLAGYPFRVLGSGWGKYRYCAVHEVARVGFTPSDALPCVRVQPTSLGLHALGPDVLVLWVRNLLDALGIDATLQVARPDLHADFHGLDITAEERSNFVGYSNRRALYEVDEALSGLNFGSRGGALYAGIYDKTRELDGKGDDWWHDIWGTRYDADQPVIRVEFEFSRTGLREFDIDTPEEAFARLGALWAYATGTWLSLRVPTGDDTRSRWPVDPRWHAVQRATLVGNSLPAERIKAGQNAGSLRKLMPQLVGCLTSAAVHLGTDDPDATIAALAPHIAHYEAQTDASFAERVDNKRRRL